MSCIKVLHIGFSANMGGIEKYLINIYRKINKEEIQMDFLILGEQKPCFYEEIKENTFFIKDRKENYFAFKKQLKEFLQKSNYDFIHIHLMSFSLFEPIIYAKKYTNANIILHSHIADNKIVFKKTKLLSWIGERFVKSNTSFLKLACSSDAGKDMFQNFKNKEFKVCNNGIKIDEFFYNELSREKIRKNLNIKDDEFAIGNVGRFVEQKNHIFLAKIYEEITKLNPKTKLVLIGNGPLRDEVKRYMKDKKIENNVIYLDYVNNVNEYMSAFDSFLFPSLFEGLGIVLIEAQASGLNCIITDSLPEEVNCSKRIKRLSLKDNTIQEWAQATLEKSIHREEVKDNEKLNGFDIDNTVNELVEFYKRNTREDSKQ